MPVLWGSWVEEVTGGNTCRTSFFLFPLAFISYAPSLCCEKEGEEHMYMLPATLPPSLHVPLPCLTYILPMACALPHSHAACYALCLAHALCLACLKAGRQARKTINKCPSPPLLLSLSLTSSPLDGDMLSLLAFILPIPPANFDGQANGDILSWSIMPVLANKLFLATACQDLTLLLTNWTSPVCVFFPAVDFMGMVRGGHVEQVCQTATLANFLEWLDTCVTWVPGGQCGADSPRQTTFAKNWKEQAIRLTWAGAWTGGNSQGWSSPASPSGTGGTLPPAGTHYMPRQEPSACPNLTPPELNIGDFCGACVWRPLLPRQTHGWLLPTHPNFPATFVVCLPFAFGKSGWVDFGKLWPWFPSLPPTLLDKEKAPLMYHVFPIPFISPYHVSLYAMCMYASQPSQPPSLGQTGGPWLQELLWRWVPIVCWMLLLVRQKRTSQDLLEKVLNYPEVEKTGAGGTEQTWVVRWWVAMLLVGWAGTYLDNSVCSLNFTCHVFLVSLHYLLGGGGRQQGWANCVLRVQQGHNIYMYEFWTPCIHATSGGVGGRSTTTNSILGRTPGEAGIQVCGGSRADT